MAPDAPTYNPRKPKTNAELVGIINRYWGRPVAGVARVKDGTVTYETIVSATRNVLPYGVTSLPRRFGP